MLARFQDPELAGLKPPKPFERAAKPSAPNGPVSQEARSPVVISNSSLRHSKPPARLRAEASPTSIGYATSMWKVVSDWMYSPMSNERGVAGPCEALTVSSK